MGRNIYTRRELVIVVFRRMSSREAGEISSLCECSFPSLESGCGVLHSSHALRSKKYTKKTIYHRRCSRSPNSERTRHIWSIQLPPPSLPAHIGSHLYLPKQHGGNRVLKEKNYGTVAEWQSGEWETTRREGRRRRSTPDTKMTKISTRALQSRRNWFTAFEPHHKCVRSRGQRVYDGTTYEKTHVMIRTKPCYLWFVV